MKYGCKSIWYLFSVLFLLGAFNASWAMEADEIRAVAERDKDAFMGALMFEYLKEYGPPAQGPEETFASLDEVGPVAEDARPGRPAGIELKAPFQVHTIDMDAVALIEAGGDLLESLVPLDEWIIPVAFYGQDVGRLTVAVIDDTWQVVEGDIGEFAKRMKHVPPSIAPGKGLGKYVRVNAAYVDFVIASDKGVTKVFLPPSLENELVVDTSYKGPEGLYIARDVLPAIAQRIQEALESNSGQEGRVE